MDYDCDDASVSFILGLVIGAGIVIAFIIALGHLDDSSVELKCRDGKLFEVSHEGNITIYDPTYNECEEIK